MGDIYENSHITIAATASQDSSGGLFSADRAVVRCLLDKHPHLYVRKQPEYFPTRPYNTVPISMPLLTRAWVYQERRLSHRTIHYGKHQVYWECQTDFASEDSREDKTWNKHATHPDTPDDLDWGDKCVDHKIDWQKTVTEYTMLRLTYESDRLLAIAAIVDRMLRLQRVDDVYIAGLWKNSILSDLPWVTTTNKPRPARMAPSWSWASAQSSAVSWASYEFTKEAKVVSLEYTIVGAANLGEVINASIILMVPVLDLTGLVELDPAKIEGPGLRERFEDISKSAPITARFRQNNLKVFSTFFFPDYDLTTANPPLKIGCTIKLLILRGPKGYIGGIVVQKTSKNPPEYKRIGFLNITPTATKPEMLGKNDEDLTRDYDSMEDYRKRRAEGRDSLILSLPMEEVKIV